MKPRKSKRTTTKRAKPKVRAKAKSRTKVVVQKVFIRGKYDAAQTSSENENHWSNADSLSSIAANSPAVRAKLRERARYECANNGHAKGLIRTIRNDVVGTGPRAQITFPETYFDPDFQREIAVPTGAASLIEKRFRDWMECVDVAEKLRVLIETGDRDGECFVVTYNNPALRCAVKMDLSLLEGDQCTTPDLTWNDPLAVDGIRFDEYGNPTEYHFLKQHPGDPYWFNPWEYDRVSAKYVIHWFDPDRPNQKRGIPSLTPSLGIYSQLRRYTLATLSAAELAANLAGVMETDQPAYNEAGDPIAIKDMDTVPIARGQLLTLPGGWKANQFKPEQPVTSYPQFKGEVLTEAGRPVCAPRNVSTGSSAEYNYSSGRLDHLPYQRSIKITRERLRIHVLSRLFRYWLYEAQHLDDYLPANLPPNSLWDVTWHWDGFESIDPQKDAAAVEIQLRTGQKTLFDVNAADGRDGEEMLRSKAKQISLARRLEREHQLAPGTLYPLTVGEQATASEVPDAATVA